ncbi:hypothetical protein SAY86_025265 [Trapa natans]|uniref:Fungal lipase-type domain-containing protein n=1 Tax=Trapa natans TaxID=22666 RepID=A0AAN7MQQ0_TRANT|nr:hypothetical protein SAY86_025265 [Trapa natans]
MASLAAGSAVSKALCGGGIGYKPWFKRPFPCMSTRSGGQRMSVSSTAPQRSITPLSTSSTFIEEETTMTSSSCSSSFRPLLWREVQGCNDWEGLLDPLHPLLRHEIIRYGRFVAACYEAFDLDPSSRRYLNCKFGKKRLFEGVGLGDSGYEITKYIYATPDVTIPIQNEDSGTCRWIGYVAVSSDETVRQLGRRDMVVTFRGTVTNPEWIANLMSSLTPARLDPHSPRPEVKVESGFLNIYTADESACMFGVSSCREQLLSEVSRLMNKYKEENLSLTIAGHSMGSSLALLLAYDISELGLNRLASNANSETLDGNRTKVPVTVFSFGGPRVGNSAFKNRCDELGIKMLRIANVNDPFTKLPGVFLNENFRVLGGVYEFPWSCSCYAHVGVELALDFFDVQNPSGVHDLETYISLLECPGTGEVRRQNAPALHTDLLQKARDFILGAQSLNNYMLPNWWSMALDMANLIPIQSQRP